MTDSTDDFYKPFGEAKWRDLAATAGASELQLRFSIARFNGASAAKAAEIAGYSGSRDELRRAGYSAVRSTAVTALLDLAAVDSPYESALTDQEVDRKIAKLVRSGDPNVSMKAAELFDKRRARAKEAGEGPTDDGFEDWRYCRDYLIQDNGASQFMLFYRGLRKNLGGPVNYPLLIDVYTLAQGEPFGQAIFDWAGRDMNEASKDDLAKKLADKNYQLEARQKIWAEIGIKLDKNGTFSRGATHAA
jgi:hypothetical protein